MNGVWRQPGLFEKCLAASFALHCGLFFLARWTPLPALPLPPSAEIDLTTSILGGGPAKLGAPKRRVPDAKGPSLPAETKVPQALTPAEPAKPWVLPGPETKVIEKPAEPAPTPGGAINGTGTAAKPGGSGVGADEGVPGGTGNGGSGLLQLPELLNRSEVLANLRRFYPEAERRAGHEASVLVNLHIGVNGRVNPVEIMQSGGAAFDAAAKKVGELMRFSPALGKSGPVAVKIKQPIKFQLQDE